MAGIDCRRRVGERGGKWRRYPKGRRLLLEALEARELFDTEWAGAADGNFFN